MAHAVDKLVALGPTLPFPHQSSVQGVADLRELRPRAGRSRWRAFYRRIGDVFVVAAVGPEIIMARWASTADENGAGVRSAEGMTVRTHEGRGLPGAVSPRTRLT